MSHKIGLVLEGGAMRGMYTAGVLDVFLEENISFDGIVGVSAGALFGVNFLSGQDGRVIRYNRRFNKDPNYMGTLPFLKEGNVVSTEYAYNRLPKELDPFDNQAFINSGVPYYAVITNVETGLPEYVLIKDVFEQMDVLRASGSMPILSKPVKIGDNLYLDGGISDSIPYEWMFSQGYDKVVVILTQDIGYVKKPFVKPAARLLNKMPKIKEQMLLRHKHYNESIKKLKQLESEGKVYVIRPTVPIHLSKTEKNEEKLQEVYVLGKADGKRYLNGLRQYID